MKTISKYIKSLALAGVAAVTLTGCNDFLDNEPTDKLAQDNFYFDASMVRANTRILYSAYAWKDFHMNFQWKFDMLAGDLYYTYGEEGQWYFGSYTAVNAYINDGWKGLYNVILDANNIINDMPSKVTGSVTDADVKQAVSEAKVIRAYCYYTIAEVWHNAPLVDDNTKYIQANNLSIPCAPQKDLYRFAKEDCDYAIQYLKDTDQEDFRATALTAHALRAKILVTMASHSDYGYDRPALYAEAAKDCEYVIERKPNVKEIPFSNLFDVESNNGPESLLAIQCMVNNYGYGNARNVAMSRSSVIADQTWGAGKGPTICLQQIYDPQDQRRQWTYMTQGDYYPNLAKADGGYTYKIINRAPDGSVIEEAIPMHAHVKKYIIGKSADCDGQVGPNQDAANNIYLLRLADVYFLYAEALMGTADETTDQHTLDQVNSVRERANLPALTSMTYEELLRQRRMEFAFESCNWYDVLRYRYRFGDAAALDLLNTGYHTGYNRSAQYISPQDLTTDEENDNSKYPIVDNVAEYGMYNPIMLDASCFQLPIPASVSSASPILLQAPVNYYND